MKAMQTKLIVSALALVLVAGCASSGAGRFARMDNQQFYDAAGKFDVEAAKRVYLDFLKRRSYPVDDNIAGKVYVSDFGLGRFTEVGLGVIIWCGDEKYGYTGLDIFLLPGQVIPEHWHVRVGDIPEKMESWLVRHGEVYACVEGPDTPNRRARLSSADAAHFAVKNERTLRVGDVAGITRPMEKHWMQAGPQGAIVSEFSTFHTGEAVRFTDPKVKF